MELNPEQTDCVEAWIKPILVIAGPGSGKTRTLINRINFLTLQGVKPANILAITFTNKAVSELKHRLSHKAVSVYTFHSFCTNVIRQFSRELNIGKVQIIDAKKKAVMIKEIAGELGVEYRPQELSLLISKAKKQRYTPETYRGLIGKHEERNVALEQSVADVWDEYGKQMKMMGLFDFDDLLFLTVKLLKDNKDARKRIQRQYQHVLVDEFQDVNDIQFFIAKALVHSGQTNSIFAVGDPNQSVYAFRGASKKAFDNFRSSFPERKEVLLRRNYRSTRQILNCANAVLRGLSKKTQLDSEGMYSMIDSPHKVIFETCKSEADEVFFVIEQISHLQSGVSNFSLDDVAILYRSRYQSTPFEERFLKFKIPYRITEKSGLFDRMEVSKLLSYFKIISHPSDDLSLKDVLNVPPRGLGKKTIQKIWKYSNEVNSSMLDVIRKFVRSPKNSLSMRIDDGKPAIFGVSKWAALELSASTKKSLRSFINILDEAKPLTHDVCEVFSFLLGEISWKQYCIKQSNGEEKWERVKKLEKILNDCEETQTLEEFLEEQSMNSILKEKMSNSQSSQRISGNITLSTIHAAKGLEWKYVFVVGCANGLLPHMLSNTPKLMDEERRLLYVAMTRAKLRLYTSYFVYGNDHGNIKKYDKSEFFRNLGTKDDVEFRNYEDKGGKKRWNTFAKSKSSRKRKYRGSQESNNGFQKASFAYSRPKKQKRHRNNRNGIENWFPKKASK